MIKPNFIVIDEKNRDIKLEKVFENDFIYLNVSMKSQLEIPEKFIVKWTIPATNSCSIWSAFDRTHLIRPDWGMNEINSRLASGLPIQQLVSFDGKNKMCVSVSDVDTPIKIRMGYNEETANVICEVEFFSIATSKRNFYNSTIRIDFRNLDYYDSIYDTVNWWENTCGYTPAFVPNSATLPMDSLWYSFHQMLNRDEILTEVKLSKELGMETVIIDDGWQTDDNNRGYAFCGDWLVCETKMGDMASLVDEIHKIGMKVILWFSVPFMGVNSKKFSEFEGMLLDKSGDEKTFFALDPRYKKVREYLSNLYESAVLNWHLDGLKLDFIDSFVLRGKSLEYDKNRDFEALEDAIHALLTETKERLTKINKDILIEFRQSYVGPSIRKYGNMLRVGDCPGDVITNRSQIINLRYTSNKTAVHSDMLMWNVDDSESNAALQIINSIFAVPQISMLIKNLPSSHKKMLQFYLSFWRENKTTLLNGKLTADNPESEYSIARSTLANKEVVVSYTNSLVEILKESSVVINATKNPYLVIKNAKGYKAVIKNCLGEILDEFEIELPLFELEMPTSSILFLQK